MKVFFLFLITLQQDQKLVYNRLENNILTINPDGIAPCNTTNTLPLEFPNVKDF